MRPSRAAALLVLAAACASAPPAAPPKQAWPAPAPAVRRPSGGPASASAPAPASAAGPLPPAGPWTATPPPPPLARPPSVEPRVAEVTLPSGLRVVVVEHHRRPVVSLRLVLAEGSRSDPEGAAGATWLATHLATDFRERDDRGEADLEEKSLRRQLVDLGASAWAGVDPDGALLAVDGYAADLGRALELLAEAVVSPRCGQESFDGRRDAMLDAIEDVESGDPEALQRVLEEAAFGPGHPYARPVYGTKTSLAPLGVEQVLARQKALFVPRGATLLVVGDVQSERALALARKAFARWTEDAEVEPDTEALVAAPRPPPARATPARSVAFLRRQPAATLLACATRPLGDVRASDAALEVFGAVLGGGYASRLADALRERHQLTYAASADVVIRRHARALLVCAPLASVRAADGLRIFRETLEALRAAPPGAAELARAKAGLAARLETANEDVAHSTGTWLEALLLGHRRPRTAEDRAAVAQVTAAEVHAIAQTALRAETLRWVVSGAPRASAQAVQSARLGPLVPYAPRD